MAIDADAPPAREVRAVFEPGTLRVYQAFSREIAERALGHQTFVEPFKRTRMTWIKPSFAWMMYRSGWGNKPGQECVLGIDISRSGFEWALGHSCLSSFDPAIHESLDAWRAQVRAMPVRVQWDPERDLALQPMPWRTIQLGLSGSAVQAYVDEWIVRIEDVTPLARQIEVLVKAEKIEAARRLAPDETSYPVPRELALRIGCTEFGTGRERSRG